MTAGRPSRDGRAPASQRVAMAVLVGLGVLVGGASAAFAQEPPTTTTTQATTTTRPAPTTTTSPPTTAPPTTQETAPPDTSEPPPPADNDSEEPVVDEEEPADEAAAAGAFEARGITFTTVANLLVPGDGTEGAQATTTTTAPSPGEGSSADDENRLIWMIIAGLAGVAVLVAVLTWRYWLLTRPGLVLEGDEAGEAGEVRRGGGPGHGGAAPPGRVGPSGGQGGPDAVWDEPRDPRRTFVGPPDAGGAPGGQPVSGAPIPGRQGAGAGPEGARRRRGGPGAPGAPGAPGRRGAPPPGGSGRPPGPPGEGEAKRRRRDPGAGPTQGQGGPPPTGGRRRSQPGERDPRGGDSWFRRAQSAAGSARRANDLGSNAARRSIGRRPGDARAQPPARSQPLAGGRSMRDTDIWAPDRRH